MLENKKIVISRLRIQAALPDWHARHHRPRKGQGSARLGETPRGGDGSYESYN